MPAALHPGPASAPEIENETILVRETLTPDAAAARPLERTAIMLRPRRPRRTLVTTIIASTMTTSVNAAYRSGWVDPLMSRPKSSARPTFRPDEVPAKFAFVKIMSFAAQAAASVTTARFTPRVRKRGQREEQSDEGGAQGADDQGEEEREPEVHRQSRGEQSTDGGDRVLRERQLARVSGEHHERQHDDRHDERHRQR